jgi:hypothetical protein
MAHLVDKEFVERANTRTRASGRLRGIALLTRSASRAKDGSARRLGTRASAFFGLGALVRAAPTRTPMACGMSPARRCSARGEHGGSIMVDEGLKGPLLAALR